MQEERDLGGRTVVLGVSGGVAAYKSLEVVRRLVKRGATVLPVLTKSAERFVTPLSFESLSGSRVATSMWSGPDPIPHTTLGQAADLIVVAPATANLLAKYRAGIANDLLTATLLATRASVLVCPAMHTEMWEHRATQENISVLEERGVHILMPGRGELAGGDSGVGRMREPAEIVERIAELLGATAPPGRSAGRSGVLRGRRVLVTAGGTREPIDPVRFIGNRSSGKMGHALASAACAEGADVVLVTTNSHDAPVEVEVIPVETASDMEKEVAGRFGESDIVLMAAAVADFRPRSAVRSKIKKSEGSPVVELVPTPDILAQLGAEKSGQFVVGFAAETDDLLENAAQKLREKNVDLIVANDVSQPDAGFDTDTNRVTLLWAGGDREELPLQSKAELARVLIKKIAQVNGG